MSVKKRKSGTGWRKPSRRAVNRKDEMPEWTEKQLDRAELARGGRIIRRAQGTLTRGRGRPSVESPKAVLSLRLHPDVIKKLKAIGPDWRKRAAKAIERIARD